MNVPLVSQPTPLYSYVLVPGGIRLRPQPGFLLSVTQVAVDDAPEPIGTRGAPHRPGS